MAITSLEKGWIEVNDRLCEIVGYSRDELTKLTWVEITHPDDIEANVDNFNRILAGEIDSYSMDKRFIRKDNKVIHASISVKCVRNDDRSIDYFIALVQDISQRIEFQTKLEEKQNQLLEAQSLAHMGNWELNPVTHKTNWSDEVFHILGIPRTESVGPDFLSQRIHEQDRERVLSSLVCGVNTGKKHNEVYRVTRPDGEIRWVHCEAENIKEPKSQLFRLKGIFQDITEQKLQEERLKEQENQLRDLLDSTSEAIFGIDNQGDCTFANPACLHLLGYTDNKELLGKNMHQMIHYQHQDGSSYPVESCELYQATCNGKSVHLDNEVFWKADNTPLSVETWSHPIIRNKQIKGAVITFLDISERKEAEQALRQSQKMDALGQLTGGIAHDYNNLLGVIMGYTELLQLKLANNGNLLGYLQHIEQASERGKAMTEKLLNFSRKKSGKPQKIDINSVIEDDKEFLVNSLTTAVTLNLELKKNVWPIWVDTSEFQNLLLNMAINSSHAMPDGGTFTLKTQNIIISTYSESKYQLKSGDYVLLSITDTGVGIDSKTSTRIFEPFFSTKGDKGTGLGLSQVFGFIKRCGGNIQVSSQVGKGTEFQIFFPRYRKKLNENQITLLNEKEVIKFGNECILVVDDEPSLRSMVDDILSTYGYKVIQAETGEKALQSLSDNSDVQLIITDVVMPKMNGFQLATKVKQNFPNIPIQLVSGYSSIVPRDDNHQDLSNAIMYKPYKKRDLLKRVREILDGKLALKPTKKASLPNIIQWSDNMSIGVENIDKDHKKLIDLINQCINLEQQETAKSSIKEILDELLDYTDYHFKREELLMEQIGYPHITKHQQVHKLLIKEVKQRVNKFKQGHMVIQDLVEFLSAWLEDHIMGMDKLIVSESKIKDL